MRKWKTSPNYVVCYILLLGVALDLFRNSGTSPRMLLYLLAADSMIDLTFSKNRAVAIANWIPIVAVCGVLFLLRACLQGEWIKAVLYALALLSLAVSFAHIWNKEIRP